PSPGYANPWAAGPAWATSSPIGASKSRTSVPSRASSLARGPIMTIYERALAFVSDGDTIGLGSGRAAAAFTQLLGKRLEAGLRVRGVPTSRASEELALRVGVPLVSLEEGMPLAVT